MPGREGWGREAVGGGELKVKFGIERDTGFQSIWFRLALGLENAGLVMLPLTLVVSVVTFGSGKANILQGVVHLVLFRVYILLVFEG